MPFLHKRCNTDHYNSNKYVKIKPKNGYRYTINDKNWVYNGHWVNDNRQGFGILAKQTKCKTFIPKYRGNWHDDRRHGRGNEYYIDGSYYMGHWLRGLRHGYGKMWYSDGSFYAGDWKCGKRCGLGLFVKGSDCLANIISGDRYEGNWVDDKKHGFGRLFHLSTGQLQEGFWYENEAISTSIEDIPFRQTAVYPTEYPIQEVKLKNKDIFLPKEFVNLLDEDETLFSREEVRETKESIKSLTPAILREMYMYV